MTRRRHRLCLAVIALASGLAACSPGPDTEEYVVISNGEAVGKLTAEVTARSVSIEYAVDDNGRGPKISERLSIDQRGMPVTWVIDGTSLFGAAVHEEYTWRDGQATWRSQADEGSADIAAPGLYVANDASPWSLGLYARAALSRADGAISLLPAGTLRVEKLETMEVGEPAIAASFWRMTGIELTPRTIVLDRSGALFAVISGRGLTLRAGYEHVAERLLEVSRSLEEEGRHALGRRLAHRYERPVRIDNVHVFDPASGTGSDPVSVLVRGERIAAVGAGAMADDAVAIDGEGGTLLAGLADMHAHNTYDSGLFYLAAGVTSTRDMGNDTALLGEMQQEFDAGSSIGPRITPDGLIEARTPFSVRIGIVADTLDDALDAVSWYADHGYYEIKIYNSMKPDWIAPVIAKARALGLGVTGHVPAFTSPNDMIRAGYDSIAHVNQLMLGWLLEPGEDTRTPLRLTGMKRAADLDLDAPAVAETIGLMREHGTALDTTAIILERLMTSRAGEVQPGDAPYLAHMPIGYQRYRRRTFVPLDAPGDDEAYDAAFEVVLETIKRLYDAGVTLLIGTDDGTGFSVHRELELYVQSGIPARDALGIATVGAARYLGRDNELGRIAPGYLADFLLVAGDPVQDIGAIRRIRLVSRGGTLYFPDEIYPELGIEPFVTGARPDAAPGETPNAQ